MRKLILATNNKNKVNEIKKILKNFNLEILTLKDLSIDIDVEENGTSFGENALIKAKAIAQILLKMNYGKFLVMADDSGLEVDYLNGAPGIYSARYSGIHGDDESNNEKLLKELEGVPFEKRSARFKCSIAIISESGENKVVSGAAEGFILDKPAGKSGFGYDPLFYYPELKKTFAELTSEEKNEISHRAKALINLKNEMGKFI